MQRISLILFGVLLATAPLGQTFHRQASGEPEIPGVKLVGAIRLLNTNEYRYRDENGRFADRDKMLAFLRQKDLLSKSPIDLENPTPYELAIATTSDGTSCQRKQSKLWQGRLANGIWKTSLPAYHHPHPYPTSSYENLLRR